MCVRVCVYRCIYAHIYTHRHTRTYKDGNTHLCECVCVCVCMWAHARIYGEGASILQKGLFCSKLIKASDNSTSKRETSPDEWSGQEAQTPLFKTKVEQTDTQKHKVENKSMAGLDWAGAAGVGGGGRLTEAPWHIYLDNDNSNSEGKGPGAGITIVTASSKYQKTVASDRSNVSFLQLRKMVVDSERSDLITWHLTEREIISLGKRVLWSLRTLHQRFLIRPNPPTLRSAHRGDKEEMDLFMCGIDTYT